jgi:chromate transporter
MMDETNPPLGEMAAAFFRIGLTGFGGVGPIARHVIVVEQRWLDDRGYAALVGICQVLPGANTVNVAVLLGDRHHGLRGAAVCLVALMLAPLGILVGLISLYEVFAAMPLVQLLLAGAAASAAGLIAGTAGKLLMRSGARPWQLGIAAAAFSLVGLMGWSVPMTLALLALPALVLAALMSGKSA